MRVNGGYIGGGSDGGSRRSEVIEIEKNIANHDGLTKSGIRQ